VSAALPWFKFYATDWLADPRVRCFSLAQRGAYVDLLALAWQEGGVIGEPVLLRRFLGDPGAEQISDPELDAVLACFSLELVDGRRSHPKLEAVRSQKQAEQRAGATGGKASGEARRRKAASRHEIERPFTDRSLIVGGSSKQPEPEPEPESETRNVSTTDEAGRCKLGKCDGRGAIRASGGRILRCCDCEIGLRRGREFAAGRQSEERAAAEKPADLGAQSPRGNRDGPTKLELPPGLALGSPQEPKTGGA